MTTTSSVSSSTPTVSTGNAQDVSSLTTGSVTLSLAEAVTTKVQPYLDQASAIQTEINTNQTQIAAYQNLQSLLTSLASSVSNLTTEAVTGTNVFTNRVANLSSSGSTAASSILNASVASGTTTGTHTILVNSLAAAESDTSATLALSSTDSISSLSGYDAADGSVTIAASGFSSPVSVSLSSSDTLSDVAAAINGVSSTNGVTASVVSVDSSHQVLVVTAADPDQTISFSDTGSASGSPGILQTLGLVGDSLTGSTAPSSATAALGLSGGFTINSNGQTLPITVSSTDSVTTIEQAINDANVSGITASLSSSNQLVISGASNVPLSFSSVSGTALSGLGFAQSGAQYQATAPTAANLTVDGISGITRSSNTISDVLSGITLNLTQASSNTVTLQVAPDTNGATTAINNFVTAYNSWESFVTQNEATDSSGGAASGAVLFGDSTLREASLQIDNAITQEVNNTSLGALGISLNSSNQLVVDSTTLSQALSNNFDTVANLFQSTVTTSSANLVPSSINYSSYSGTFSLDISASNGSITSLSLNGGSASGDFTFSGNTISGVSGSPYDGIYLTYNGSGEETVSVTSTNGIANQVYSVADDYANTSTGSVQQLIQDKQNQDIGYTTDYNNWIDEANNYTTFLTQQYSDLTSQIQSNGQTLQTLNALFTAQYSSNG